MSTNPYDPTSPAGGTPPPPPSQWPATPPPAAPPAPPTWAADPSGAPAPPAYPVPPQQPAGYGQQPGYPQQPPAAYPPQGVAPGQAPLSPAESRQFAMFGHLGGIILGFLGPLIVMLVWGPRDGFTKDQATEALNFQITLLIGYLVSFVLVFIIPFPLSWIVWLAGLIFAVLGGLEANKGVAYRYPFALRLVK